MDCNIRLMRQEDAIQMADIAREAFPSSYPPPNYQREFRNPLAHYLIAFDDSNASGLADYMIGYGGFWLMAGEAHIVDIAVRESYRGKGIGELLLIYVLDLALDLDARQATLEVRVSNEAASNLYSKYGFKSQGIRRRYYLDDNEDALIMTAERIDSQEFKDRFQDLKNRYSLRWSHGSC